MDKLIYNLLYSNHSLVTKRYVKGFILFIDDWLKRDRFVFISWSGCLLFPAAYLSIGGWFTGSTFITAWFTHGLASSYIEGCNFLSTAVSIIFGSYNLIYGEYIIN